MSSACDSPLGGFLAASGGQFHSALYSKQDAFGTSIYTSQTLPPSTSVVSCPFSLCITPTLAREAIPTSLFSPPSSDETGSSASTRKNRQPNHELLVLYLVLHTLPPSLISNFPKLRLDHGPYVSNLPKADSFRTTLFFTPQERELLRGSNLYGATEDRERMWKEEWQELTEKWISDERVRKELTWERWLWASSIVSSRAFPSHLLDNDKSNSTPVLFPGIDMLNHKPTAKLTWSSDVHTVTTATREGGKDGLGMFSIVVDEEVPADSQVFNTYGAKSNEELLLGYGFVLASPPANPADCVALKLSLPPNCSEALFDLIHLLKLENMRHFVGRNGQLPEELKAQMRLLLSPPEEVEEIYEAVKGKDDGEIRWQDHVAFLGWETELDMLDTLEGMLGSKMMGLQSVDTSQGDEGIREDVREMVDVYRQGQIEIIENAIRCRDELMAETMKKAEEDGVEMDFEEEDEQ
ncbi:SET domain-containing protein [Sporobolomyces salmoneus]|uniref:SET domain-containing protein n=1 Tax=Sporobolomyces salmoneus TaxID=183962 RepID=UPI0031800A76